MPVSRGLRRSLFLSALIAGGFTLCGCADMSETLSPAFADPGKYDLWDCKQLEGERKNLATRSEELQKLRSKAETGVGGSVVAEMVYGNDVVAVKGQSHYVDKAWQRNRCVETPPSPPPAANPPLPPEPKVAAKGTKGAKPRKPARPTDLTPGKSAK
ncbi:MAG: twin-arginine translocation pathway signal [Alphaproteobacteria bacterium]|nr:twin-arginine translocation pathway signal [Alphaproteobacteria bacterium]